MIVILTGYKPPQAVISSVFANSISYPNNINGGDYGSYLATERWRTSSNRTVFEGSHSFVSLAGNGGGGGTKLTTFGATFQPPTPNPVPIGRTETLTNFGTIFSASGKTYVNSTPKYGKEYTSPQSWAAYTTETWTPIYAPITASGGVATLRTSSSYTTYTHTPRHWIKTLGSHWYKPAVVTESIPSIVYRAANFSLWATPAQIFPVIDLGGKTHGGQVFSPINFIEERKLNMPIQRSGDLKQAYSYVGDWNAQKPPGIVFAAGNGASARVEVYVDKRAGDCTFDGGFCSEGFECFTYPLQAYRETHNNGWSILVESPGFVSTVFSRSSESARVGSMPPNTAWSKLAISTVPAATDNAGQVCRAGGPFFTTSFAMLANNTMSYYKPENASVHFRGHRGRFINVEASRIYNSKAVFSEPAIASPGKTGTTTSMANRPNFVTPDFLSINYAGFLSPFVHTWTRTFTVTDILGKPFEHTTTTLSGTSVKTVKMTTAASWWVSRDGTRTMNAFVPAWSTLNANKTPISTFGEISFFGAGKYTDSEAATTMIYSGGLRNTAILGPRWDGDKYSEISATYSLFPGLYDKGNQDPAKMIQAASWKGMTSYNPFFSRTEAGKPQYNQQTSYVQIGASKTFVLSAFSFLVDAEQWMGSSTTVGVGYQFPRPYAPVSVNPASFRGGEAEEGQPILTPAELVEPWGTFDKVFNEYPVTPGFGNWPKTFGHPSSASGWWDQEK